MRLPPDWDAENNNGMFQYQVNLIHEPCGFRTGGTFDLLSYDPHYGEPAVRRVVYGHTCEPED